MGDGVHEGTEAAYGSDVAALGPEVASVHYFRNHHLHRPTLGELHLGSGNIQLHVHCTRGLYTVHVACTLYMWL